ncbi:phosphocholine cytidylyltransferase family protein [Paracoccaceae bacterium]|nr:phosphocholine cytidylyltransferase family protein [Paracoccaceae bacterium]
MAAGTGSRMSTLTKEVPKAGIHFLGKPLISYQLKALAEADIDNITVVTGHCASFFEDYEVQTVYNPLYAHVNMVTSLYCGLQASSLNQDLLITYSDIIYSSQIIKNMLSTSTETDLMVSADPQWLDLWRARMNDVQSDAETFDYDQNKNLLTIGGKISDLTQVNAQYRGLIFVSRKFVKSLKEIIEKKYMSQNNFNIYMTDLLMDLVTNGVNVKVDLTPGAWLEFDTQNDLRTYEEALLSGDLSNHVGKFKNV